MRLKTKSETGEGCWKLGAWEGLKCFMHMRLFCFVIVSFLSPQTHTVKNQNAYKHNLLYLSEVRCVNV